jgi:ribosomal protein L40E
MTDGRAARTNGVMARTIVLPHASVVAHPAETLALVCLQCGTPAARADATFCRRCGLSYGTPPSAFVELPSCPICYMTVDDDGRLESLDHPGLRVDLVRHQAEHDRHPVGDDEWLESLREGDRLRVDRWSAPFDVVRHYLVTGQVDGGRHRQMAHDALVTAMTQLRRFGPDADILGDQPEWAAARTAVSQLLERYSAGRR